MYKREKYYKNKNRFLSLYQIGGKDKIIKIITKDSIDRFTFNENSNEDFLKK